MLMSKRRCIEMRVRQINVYLGSKKDVIDIEFEEAQISHIISIGKGDFESLYNYFVVNNSPMKQIYERKEVSIDEEMLEYLTYHQVSR